MIRVSPRPWWDSRSFRREGREMDNAQNTEVVLEEALIEEVSIDGMCGVY